MTKKLSIIVPVFNNWPYTKNCLNYLLQLNNNYEIIVVDNASSDETAKELDILFDKYENLNILRLDKNYGFGAAINEAYAKSIGNYVMILNNDIKCLKPINEWIDDFVDFIKDYDGFLIGPSAGYVDPHNEFSFVREIRDASAIDTDYNYMSGWCLTASRETWNRLILKDEIGPFDTKNFFLYYEDTDLGFRARESIPTINFLIKDIPFSHLERKTSSKYNMSKFYKISKEIFIKKWKHKLLKKEVKLK